ncbi:DinB family protein [Sabulicella glaciei]|uniref:Damage-inducible protein DinB n=1 Tax=Sabulicella glaciei TaxID=2984948 RepID=A0ABT3NUA3_9PROT|nr:DinB family protein [Roseococcus sp. MDT2-1-1]MCW8085736.1 damage-inducible protein DinB [Roseococcus sp. MDT2-1-1]
MITPRYVQTMAAYNSEMNRRTFAAGDMLEEAQRRAEDGAFFGSLHGTLSHLLWADAIWMHRFAGWDAPAGGIPGSAALHPDWDAMREARFALDARIEGWAAEVTQPWLDADFTWTNSQGKVRTNHAALLVMHLFNHGTHHRGQAHALLTRHGARTADTDLPWVVSR